MKRRILALVTAVALILSMSVFTVSAEFDVEHHCICGTKTGTHLPGCDGTVKNWTAWNDATTLPGTTGNYYLNADVVLAGVVELKTEQNIVLDLNGHTVTSTTRVYQLAAANINDSLTVLDSAGGGKFVMTTLDGGATFATIGNTGNKTVTIYGGTFDASAIVANNNGGFMRVASKTSTLNIHGGTIIGGKANAGGTIHVGGGGKVNMTGGVIRDGSAGSGGNIFLNDSGSSFAMYGGEVYGGKATATNGRGGNIFSNGCTVLVTDSAKVHDGTAVTTGANIHAQSTYTTAVSEGCVYLTAGGDGIYPDYVDPSTCHCICGCKDGNHLPGCDGTLHSWTAWDTTDSMPNAAGYYYLNKDVTTSTSDNLKNGQSVFIDLNGHTVNSSANRLFLVNDSNANLTLLDTVGTGKIKMTGSNGGALAHLPNANNKVLTIYGGTYDASAMTISSTRSGGLISTVSNSGTATVNIHGGTLIGASVASSYTGGAVYATKDAVLNITGGEIKNGTAVGNGGNIYLESNAVMNMSGGKISGGSATIGGNVYCKDTAQITVTGGEIAGGTAGSGGNIALAAGTPSLTVSGGAIHDGKATAANGRGGNIFNNNATVTVSGSAKVYDGTAVQNGPNIFSQGDSYVADIASGCAYFTEGTGDGIYPATIVVGTEYHCVCGSLSDTHLPGCDGTMHTWTAWNTTDAMPGTAGYYYLNTDVTVSATNNLDSKRDIFIDLNGHTVTSSANRLYILNKSNTTLTLLDTVGTGKIVMSGSNGGALAHLANENNKVLTIYGGTYDASAITAGGTRNGVVVSTDSNSGTATINIHGGTVIGGKTATGYAGGAISLGKNSVLNMTAGTIRDGESVLNGGNLMLDAGAAVNISGGVISGGTAVTGGNMYCRDGSVVTMTGGEIAGGSAGSGGNIALLSGSSLTMTDGKIHDGEATATNGRGGNIFNNASTITISGDAEVYDGTAVQNGPNIFNSGEYTADVEEGCAYFTEGTGDGIYPAKVVIDTQHHCICGSMSDTHLPGCDGTIQLWTAWDTADAMPDTAGYYYLNTDVETSATNNLTTARDIFIDLNGHTVNSSANRLYILNGSNSTLTLLDTAGTGKIVMAGSNGGALAHLANKNNKVLTIYGGTYDASAITAAGTRNGVVVSTDSNAGSATVNIHGGTVIGGIAGEGYGGGAISITNNAVLNITGGEIKDGSSVGNGGNIYLVDNGTMGMSGGKISGGNAVNGGNMYARGNIQITVSGGEIAGGIAGNGGNISLTVDTKSEDAPSLAVTNGKIHDGEATADNGRGGNIFNNAATVIISDDAEVFDGTAVRNGDNIFSQGAYTSDVEDGCAYITESRSNGIYPYNTKFVGFDANGNETTTDIFADATAENTYVRLMTGEEIALAKDTVVDVNNQTVSINTNGFALSLLDCNSTISKSSSAAVTVSDAADVNKIAAKPGSADQFLAIANPDGTFTPYWIYVKLTTASLRPADTSVGIYYKSAIQADPALKGYIKTYGIAASLASTPDDFRNEANVGYTEQTFEVPEGSIDITAFSGVIENILQKDRKEPTLDQCGKMPIYVVAYVGVEIGDTSFDVTGVAHSEFSLYSLMGKLNASYEGSAAPDNVKALVANWSDPMSGWGLDNLK